jgi:pimeloyl-ACP methyl ester carboxylesterase
MLVSRARRPTAETAPEPELEPAPGDPPAMEPSANELVLLHGQPGGAADWQAVIARLPSQLHAVATDRPGYGTSQRPAAGFSANARAVLEDLDERNVDSAVLVAHSWAGGIALQAAALAPHRVKAVVLLAGVGPGSVSILDWLLAAPVFGPVSAQIMWRWTPWIARARLAWLRRRHGRPLDPGENISLQVWGQKGGAVEPLWRAFLTEQRALLSELADLETTIPSIGVPVLLLADPADQIVPIMTAERLAEELPNAQLRLVSHASHHLPRRAPDAVVEAITGFLATLDETGPVDNGSQAVDKVSCSG